mmetsp:Transcript_19188/g.17007  ORF Transcript_19188/g.17007 Transcript_19188/m.17007 type:complete len:221 (+) Transcript_19188:197-859(+)
MSKIMTRKANVKPLKLTVNPSIKKNVKLSKNAMTRMNRDGIAKENLRLLNRLQSTKPSYDFCQWKADFKKHSKRVKKISQYKNMNTTVMCNNMPKIVNNNRSRIQGFKSMDRRNKINQNSRLPSLKVTVKERNIQRNSRNLGNKIRSIDGLRHKGIAHRKHHKSPRQMIKLPMNDTSFSFMEKRNTTKDTIININTDPGKKMNSYTNLIAAKTKNLRVKK